MLDSTTIAEADANTRRFQELDAEAPGPHILEIGPKVPAEEIETVEPALEFETLECALELESRRPIAELQGTTVQR